MEDTTKKEIAELKKVLSDALAQIERLTGSVSKEEPEEDSEVTLEDSGEAEVTIAIFIVDGVDFNKVMEDGIDVDDVGSYIDVFPKDGDLVGRGLTAGSVRNQMGVTERTNTNIQFKSLPEEYYLSTDDGGVPYTHFPSSQRDYPYKPDPKIQLQKVVAGIERAYGETANEENTTHNVEAYIDCSIIEEVSNELEELRGIGDVSLIHTLDKEAVEHYFTKGVSVNSLLRGYFVNSHRDTGVNITTVSFMLSVEGTPGVWVFNYNGLYQITGQEEVYALMETEHPDLCEFMLDSVINVPEEKLHELIIKAK